MYFRQLRELSDNQFHRLYGMAYRKTARAVYGGTLLGDMRTLMIVSPTWGRTIQILMAELYRRNKAIMAGQYIGRSPSERATIRSNLSRAIVDKLASGQSIELR